MNFLGALKSALGCGAIELSNILGVSAYQISEWLKDESKIPDEHKEKIRIMFRHVYLQELRKDWNRAFDKIFLQQNSSKCIKNNNNNTRSIIMENKTVKNGVVKTATKHIMDYDYSTICGANNTYPKEFEIDRANTGALRHQKFENCVAEVISQIAEAHWNKVFDSNEEHSEGFVYGGYRNEYSNYPGMVVSRAMDYWRKLGTVPKKYFDIDAEMPEMKQIVKKYPDLFDIAKKYKLGAYFELRNTGKIDRDTQIKDALLKYGYGLVAVSPKGFAGGSHCIMITGWNDNNGKYKFKNSWGAKYGDNGFSEIDKDKISEVYLPIFDDIELPFTDVNKDDWFYKSIKNMYFMGFANGTSDTTFEPNKPMTRAEVFTLVERVLKEVDKRFDLLDRVDKDKKEYTGE